MAFNIMIIQIADLICQSTALTSKQIYIFCLYIQILILIEYNLLAAIKHCIVTLNEINAIFINPLRANKTRKSCSSICES